MNIIGIIPARGGSKRLPKKNIRLIKEKPLIVYSIEQALNSVSLSRVIVSTDDNETAEIAKQAGAEVPFLRPKELATDTVPTGPVLQHAANFLEENEKYEFDAIMTLQPTCPLRTQEDIEKSIRIYEELQCETLFSASPAKTPPWSTWTLEPNKSNYLKRIMKYPTGENPANMARQKYLPVYEANGTIYITSREYLKKTGNWIHPEKSGCYMMSSELYVDVDTEYDMMILEAVIDKFIDDN